MYFSSSITVIILLKYRYSGIGSIGIGIGLKMSIGIGRKSGIGTPLENTLKSSFKSLIVRIFNNFSKIWNYF